MHKNGLSFPINYSNTCDRNFFNSVWWQFKSFLILIYLKVMVDPLKIFWVLTNSTYLGNNFYD